MSEVPLHGTEAKLVELASGGRAVLFLVPLAAVAWAEGQPGSAELVAIASHHARGRCAEELGCFSAEARQFFYYHFVYGRPSAALVGLALLLLARFLAEMPPEAAGRTVAMVRAACEDVARSAGGGVLRNGRSAKEQRAIEEMVSFVRPRDVESGREVAARLGFGDGQGGAA
jgi:hypothetical protein